MTFLVGEKEKFFHRSSSLIYDFEGCSEVNVYTVAVISLMQHKNTVMKLMFLLIIQEHSHELRSPNY
jgi:hypothetical protein